jgi:hypothetical protein
MDTKLCLSCHKLLRADALSCSLCGYVFSQAPARRKNKATNGSRRSETASIPSNPPASPHRAGHYSGLHPEDQPFQSSFMPVIRPPAITRRLFEQESDEVLLPVVASSVAPQLTPVLEREKTPKRYVASPVPLALPMPQRYSGTLSKVAVPPVPLYEVEAPVLAPEQTLHEQITAPLSVPVHLPEKHHSRNRTVPILLLASCLSALLATSILGYLFLVGIPGMSMYRAMKVDRIRNQQAQSAPPTLQLSASQMDFGAVRTQDMLTLTNMGAGEINWQAGVDSNSPWLAILPNHGIFSHEASAKLSVNRSNLTSKVYTGYITFFQQGTYTPLTLKVIINVNPTASTVTVNPPPVTVTNGPSPIPVVVVDTNVLTFKSIQGNNPAPQSFTITNTGNAPLNWAIKEDSNAAAYTHLSITHGNVASGNNVSVTVTPNIAQATASAINGTITIFDTDTGTSIQSQQVALKITISNQALISVSNAILSYNLSSTTTSSSQPLDITNSGSAQLNWTLSQPLPSWLSVDIPSGTLAPGLIAFVNFTCDSTGLQAGTYTYNLVVSDTDANTPVKAQNVQVTLTVT